MNIALLLEMAADAAPDRIGLVCDGKRWTYTELLSAARGAFELIEQSGAQYVALLDESSEAAVIALFHAWRRIWRPPVDCEPGQVCAVPRVNRSYRMLFWVVTALVAVALGFPLIAPWFY